MDRRGVLLGLGGLIATPAIVPIHNLMKLPRVPLLLEGQIKFAQNDLWIQLEDTLTGQFHRLPAVADSNHTMHHVEIKCDYLSSVLFKLDRVVVGRGESDFFSMHAERTLNSGDRLRVVIPEIDMLL